MKLVDPDHQRDEPEQSGRAEETRQKQKYLLQVARDQFIRRGYRDTKMTEIAASAGVSKRTLYLWHEDKAALFRACVTQGAQLFPMPTAGNDENLTSVLKRFARDLVLYMSEPEHLNMGRLVVRDHEKFPDMMAAARTSHQKYLVEPLATWFRSHGLEAAGEFERTMLFISMVLGPVHNKILLGTAGMDTSAAERHAELVVHLFLGLSVDASRIA